MPAGDAHVPDVPAPNPVSGDGGAAPAAQESDAPSPGAAPAAPAPGAADAPAEETIEQLIELESLSPAQAKKLRSEAKNLRERYTPYRDSFEGLEEDDVQAFLWLAKQYKDDPKAAADAFLRAGKTLSEQLAEAGGQADSDPDPDAPMTRAEFAAWQQEQEDAHAASAEEVELQQSIAVIEKQAANLGYQKGTPEYVGLLFLASEDPKMEGSIEKAHAAMEARKQSIIDAYVSEKTGKARQGLGKPAPGAPATQEAHSPRTDAEAKASLLARLRAMPGD